MSYYITTIPIILSAISIFTECDKGYTVSIHERQVRQEQYTSWNKWHQYTFTVNIEIQPLNIADKSLKVRQEYDINIGKISLTKRNITT
jgi:hypothetical protein